MRHPDETPILSALLAAIVLAAALPAPAGAAVDSGPGAGQASVECPTDVVPAATLLVPYFEVDLSRPDGRTTLVAVTNTADAPALALVTLWTDWAVPSLSFYLYLTGSDVVTFNLRDVIGTGLLPDTGPAVSAHGPLSGPAEPFPGCGLDHVNESLAPTRVAEVRAWHTGRASAGDGTCASPGRGDELATGYLTVDTVRSCSGLDPSDAGYFAGGFGVATFDNVLWGEVYWVDPADDFAQGEPAVHLVADPARFTAETGTFYGRYVGGDGRDARQPLATRYAARYLDGGAFAGGTDLLVWRDTRSPAASPVACDSLPVWAPIGQDGVLAFDEEENPLALPASTQRMPWATQRVHVGSAELAVAAPFGWLDLDLAWDGPGQVEAAHPQAWVVPLVQASGRFSVGLRGLRLGGACLP